MEAPRKILNRSHHRKRITRFGACIGIAIHAEDARRPDVVRGRLTLMMKLRGKMSSPKRLASGLGIDEDVGERSGCVADVSGLLEGIERLANASIDRGGIFVLALRSWY